MEPETFGEVGFGWMKLLKCGGLDASLICDVNDVCGPKSSCSIV